MLRGGARLGQLDGSDASFQGQRAPNFIGVLSWSTSVASEAYPSEELHLLPVAEWFGHACAGFLLEEAKLQALFLVCTRCTPFQNVGIKVLASSRQL